MPRRTLPAIAAIVALGWTLSVPAPLAGAADFPGGNGITISVNPYPLLSRTEPGSPGFTVSVSDSNPNGVTFDAYYLGRVPTGWEVRVDGNPTPPLVSNPDGTSVFELPRAAAAAGQVEILPPIGFQGDLPFTLSRTSPDSPNTIIQFDGGTFDFLGDATPRLNDGPGGGDTDHDYKDPTELNAFGHYPPNDGEYTIWVTSRITGPDDPFDGFGWSDLRSVDDPLGGYGDLCDPMEAVNVNDAEDAGKFLIFNADDAASLPNRFVEFHVDLEAGRIYDFSAFLANVSEPGFTLPNVLFDINPPGPSNTSELVASGGLPRPSECDLDSDSWWQQFSAVFYAPETGSYELGLTNFAPGGSGNDLGIDNLSLREMETVAFTASVVPPAELVVTKVASDTTPDFGTNVTYTVTLSNEGAGDAGGAVVVDQLPAGLQYVSHTGPGTYDPGSGQWSVASVPAGADRTLNIVARVTGTAPIVNTVSSVSAPQDPTPCTSNCASATVTPQLAALSASKSVSDATPTYGTNVTFTITVDNGGAADATGVVAVDQLPVGLTYVSDTGPGTYNPANGTWTGFGVPAGGSASLSLVAEVTGTSAIVNRVTSLSAPQDPTPCTSNCASVTVTPQLAALTVSKSVSDATPPYASNVTFTITVDNDGAADASGVVAVDQLPAGLAYVSDTGPGTYNPANGTWSGFGVPAGGSASLQLVASVTGTSAIVNRVTSLSAPQDPTPCTSNCASVTVTPQLAELTVAKSVSDPAPVFGTTVTYTIAVTNDGATAATAVSLVDRLPAGLQYVSHVAEVGTYVTGTGVWSGFDVAVDQTRTLTIVARIVTGDDVNNVVAALTSAQDPTPCSSNCAAASVNPRTADVTVAKSVDDPTPVYLDEVTFTLTATNAGDAAATAVTVSDPLPDGLEYVSHATVTGTYDPGTGLWSGFGIAAGGGTAQLQITARVIDPADVTNVVLGVTAAEDPTSCSGDCGDATVRPRTADIVVAKAVDQPSPAYSHDVTFTITATNEGDADATGVALLDQLPPGLEYASHSGDGTYDPDTGTWTVGALAVDATATLDLVAAVRTTAPVVNTATAVVAVEDPAPCATGCTLSAAIEPRAADLAVTKVVDVNDPVYSRTATFTIEVTNNGDADASDATVTDVLPEGLAYVSDDGAGAYDPATGVWSIPLLAVEDTAELQITVGIETPEPVSNVVSVAAPEDPAPCAEGCDLDETLMPRVAAISATIDAADRRPVYGGEVALTVQVTNAGDADATDVVVDVPLPAELTYVGDDTGGTYDPSTGRWSAGALAAIDGSASFTLTASVVGAADVPVVVTGIAAPEQPEPCTTQCAAVVLDPRRAELTAELTVSDSDPLFGTDVTFTLSVSNHGDASATAALAADRLPDGLTYVGHSGPGTYDPTSGVWTIGDLGAACAAIADDTGGGPPGCLAATSSAAAAVALAAVPASATLTITASVATTEPVTNVVTAVASAQDPTSCVGVCASAVVDPLNAELLVSKTADRGAALVGEEVTYTITVQNVGNGDASGVVVTDHLPAGLHYVSDDSGGAFDAATGAWQVGIVQAGTARSLRLVTRLLATGAIVNTVSVTGGAEDPTPCGASCASVEIRSNPVDMELPATGSNARSVTTMGLAILAIGVTLQRRSRRRAQG